MADVVPRLLVSQAARWTLQTEASLSHCIWNTKRFCYERRKGPDPYLGPFISMNLNCTTTVVDDVYVYWGPEFVKSEEDFQWQPAIIFIWMLWAGMIFER